MRQAPTFAALIVAGIGVPALAQGHQVIAAGDIEWGMLNPARGDASPKAADLWGDRTKEVATGMLVAFPKGFSSPPHIHNISYRGVVIEGMMHNDDPDAAPMWLPAGSFWTQPAGENHITAANGEKNMIYLEIDSGPYLVQPGSDAFDNGERPINVDHRNLVWLSADDARWVEGNSAQLAYLWGNPQGKTGTFIKLPAGFDGVIESDSPLKAVVIKGNARYQWNEERASTQLTPSSFFRSDASGQHRLSTDSEVLLYLHSEGPYRVK
ncbi:DUF4437 domain-containing protein [Ferrimonas balearica]|uniref:DUF4437 domain-containing protein n=1 Tax=Ferrimonas balearica TaxID=44012 RepID=UPI001C55C66A|nr:DUF4437 domain-containing protein [Ferrimonas balearica]MBW3163797.1 DUF4437 domain-containing protein [Ferrimonas balearica]